MNNRALPLQAIRRQKLSDEIVRQLENLIVNNELSVGDALPPDASWQPGLGVSRNILREAISTMVQKGLLEVRQGSGTFVASPSIELLRDSLSSSCASPIPAYMTCWRPASPSRSRSPSWQPAAAHKKT